MRVERQNWTFSMGRTRRRIGSGNEERNSCWQVYRSPSWTEADGIHHRRNRGSLGVAASGKDLPGEGRRGDLETFR